MKKFNLLSEIIVVNKDTLMQAINSNQEFSITYKGEVLTQPSDKREIYIYKGKIDLPKPSALTPTKPQSLNELFGTSYQVVEDGERILIKAAGAWQEILNINTINCDYDDSTGDGIAEFTDKVMEEIGWQATEFNIQYRSIVDELEKNVDGVLLCIEQIEPYQFSGLGYIFDLESARKLSYDYCQEEVINKIKNDPEFKQDELNDDEEEAAQYFKAL